jgi:Acetyltransferase (GNAT) domain
METFKMQYEPCQVSELTTFETYLSSLSSPIDSFLEGHILESRAYRILHNAQEAGSFAIYDGSLLTHFHMVGGARRYGAEALTGIRKKYGLKAAFVPTCDEFFLSHALDSGADLKIQAYFFINGSPGVPPAIAAELAYRTAVPSDVEAIQATCGDFLESPGEGVAKGQIHVGFLGRELVAIGVIENSILLSGYASIGMFTKDSHRQKGIATGTILYLKQVCRDKGLEPIAGCWYYNQASKKTLESAGMLTITRLLRFEF